MMAGRMGDGIVAKALLAALLLPLLLSGCGEVGEFFGIGVGSDQRPLDYTVEVELSDDSSTAADLTLSWDLPASATSSSEEGTLSPAEPAWVRGTADATVPESLRIEINIAGTPNAGDFFAVRLRYTDRRAVPNATYYVTCLVALEGAADGEDDDPADWCDTPRESATVQRIGDNTGGSTMTYELPIPYNPPQSRN